MKYKLSRNGDCMERRYWSLFIKDELPSYEEFWLKFVVPLTNRPYNIYFKNDSDLSSIEKSKSDLDIAQLSYSIIRNLGRCFDVIKDLETEKSKINTDSLGSHEELKQTNLFEEFFVRLVGGQDNTFELLEKANNIYKYKSFDRKSGEVARRNWLRQDSYPLKNIRFYRNDLVHGRFLPQITGEGNLYFPKIGTEEKYLDRRIITDKSLSNRERREKAKEDFFSALEIANSAWEETLEYVETHLKKLVS